MMRTATGVTATPTLTRPASNGAVLQRKCACGGETIGGGECAQCRKKRAGMLQRSAFSGAKPREVPDIVYDVLREPGKPLDTSTRGVMESRFGRDLSAVRVHTGPRAAASAAAVDARAYTVGRSIVLGDHAGASSRHAPRQLLGHELAHTVQQGFSPAPSRGLTISTDAASERQAERAGNAVASGGAAGTLTSVSSGGVQREEAKPADAPATPDAELGWIEESLIEVVALPARALGDTPYRLVKAMMRGLAIEVKTQVKTKGPAFLEKIKAMLKSPSKAALFVLHYWWGLIKGIFSPITGLFDLGKLVIKLQLMQIQVMSTMWTRRVEMAKRADQLGADMALLADDGINAVVAFRNDPMKTLKALGPWLATLGGKAEAAAFTGGRQAGGVLMGALDKEPAELGEIVGEVVGTLVVNVALFIFTSGIGNAITQIASKLGEVGAWIGKFGKVAKMLETLVSGIVELLVDVGGLITKAETALAAMAEAVLKPLAPVLQRFGKVVSGLREFLRDLLGLAKTEAATAVETATTATAKGLEHAPPPKVAAVATPPVAPKPVVKPSAPAVKPSVPPAAAAEGGVESVGVKAAPKEAPPGPTPHTDVVTPKAESVKAAGVPDESGVVTPFKRDAPPKISTQTQKNRELLADVEAGKVNVRELPPRQAAPSATPSKEAAAEAKAVQAESEAVEEELADVEELPLAAGAEGRVVASGAKKGGGKVMSITRPKSAPTRSASGGSVSGTKAPPLPSSTGGWKQPPTPPPTPAKVESIAEFKARGGTITEVPPKAGPPRQQTAVPREGDAEAITNLGEGQEAKATQEAGIARAGMAAPPKHHVFPQAERPFFENRGFTGDRDIDKYTLVLDEAEHQAIHGGGDYKLGKTKGFDWNSRVMKTLRAQEAALGRELTFDEAFSTVERLMGEYRIGNVKDLVPYK